MILLSFLLAPLWCSGSLSAVSSAVLNTSAISSPSTCIHTGYSQPKDSVTSFAGKAPRFKKHFDDATFGLHILYLHPLIGYAAVRQTPGLGFDMDGFSRNLTSGQYYGLFLGGDASFAFMGKSKQTDVPLNTSTSDTGVSFLQNSYADFNFVARLEFGRGNIKFYATAFTGWRGLFISQKTQSETQIDGFTDLSKKIWNKSVLQWGGGAGMRYHFTDGISLDIRGTFHDADLVMVANVRHSVYDSFHEKYTLKYDLIQPQLLGIKIGCFFSL